MEEKKKRCINCTHYYKGQRFCNAGGKFTGHLHECDELTPVTRQQIFNEKEKQL